jgi:hypothetical protein
MASADASCSLDPAQVAAVVLWGHGRCGQRGWDGSQQGLYGTGATTSQLAPKASANGVWPEFRVDSATATGVAAKMPATTLMKVKHMYLCPGGAAQPLVPHALAPM